MLQIREFDLKTGKFLTDYNPITKEQVSRTKDVQGSYLEDWLNRQNFQGEEAQLSVAQFYNGVSDRDVKNVLDRGQELVFTSGKYGYFAPPAMAKALLEDSPIYDNGVAAAHNAVAYGSLIISDGFTQTKTDTGKVKILLVDNINRSLGDNPLLDRDGQLVPGEDVERLLDVMGDGTMLIPSQTMKHLLLPDEISQAIEIGLKKAQIVLKSDLIERLQGEYESEGKIRLSSVNLRAANAINNEIDLKTERTVLQFRAALSDVPGIAKGTVKTSSWAERLGVDAIISLDDVKGATIGGVFDRPGVVELNSDLWINRKDIARYGQQSVGSQVKYKLPNATTKELNPKILAQAQELAALAIDPYALAQKVVEKVERQRQRPLSIDLPEGVELDLLDNEATVEILELQENLRSSEATALVMKSDKYGQIIQLPSIATQLKKSIRSQWLDAATVGIEIPSAMAQHHAALKPWEVCNKDLPEGAIVAYYRSPFGNVGAAAIAINNPRAIESADPESYNKDGVSYMPPWTAKNIAITDFDSDRNGYFVGFIAKDPQAIIEGLRDKLKDISDPALQYAAGRTEIDRLIVSKKDLEEADYPRAVEEFVKANRPENMPLPIPKDKKVLHPRLPDEPLSVSIGKAWCITAQNPVGKVASQSMILESLAQNITYASSSRLPGLLASVIKTFGEIDPAYIPSDEMFKESGLPSLNLAERIKSVVNSDPNTPSAGLKETVSILEDYAKYPMAKNLQIAVDIAKSNKGINEDFQDFASQLAYQKHQMRLNMKKPEVFLSSPLKNNTVDPVGIAVISVNKIFDSVPEIKIDRENLNRSFRGFVPEFRPPNNFLVVDRMISSYRDLSKDLSVTIQRLKDKNITDAQPTLIITSSDGRKQIEVINLCDGEKENSVNLLTLDSKQVKFRIERNKASEELDVPMYLLKDEENQVAIGFINEKSLEKAGTLDYINEKLDRGISPPIQGTVELFPPYFLQNDTDKKSDRLEMILTTIKEAIKGKEDAFVSHFQGTSVGQNIAVKIMPRQISKHLDKVAPIHLTNMKQSFNLQNSEIRFDNAIIDGKITPIASLVAADGGYDFLGKLSYESPLLAPGTVVKANLIARLDPKINVNIEDKRIRVVPIDNNEIPLESGEFTFKRDGKRIDIYLVENNSEKLLGKLDDTTLKKVHIGEKILTGKTSGTYERSVFQSENNGTGLEIEVLSLVSHLPVDRCKILMTQKGNDFSFESAPPGYRVQKILLPKPIVPPQAIPDLSAQTISYLPSQTIPDLPPQSVSAYNPSRLELVNWYKAVGANSESGKQILELGKQLKTSYMAEEFMNGKPLIDRLPDDYRNTSISVLIEDKNRFDLAVESFQEPVKEVDKSYSISR
jgi:hypothetical protein